MISRKTLVQFWTLHPESQNALANWYSVASSSNWSSFLEVRETFRSADWVQGMVIFNIGGNNYRLVASIHFNTGKLFVRQVLTHADYSKKGIET